MCVSEKADFAVKTVHLNLQDLHLISGFILVSCVAPDKSFNRSVAQLQM